MTYLIFHTEVEEVRELVVFVEGGIRMMGERISPRKASQKCLKSQEVMSRYLYSTLGLRLIDHEFERDPVRCIVH